MTSFGSVLLTVLTAAVAIVAVFAAAFGWAKVAGKHAVVDTLWGPGFAVVALVAALVGDGSGWRRLLLVVVVGVWGMRLGVHIFLRARGAGEDPRYTEIQARAAGNPDLHMVRRVYLLQALVMLVVSLPVTVGANSTGGGGPVAVLVVVGLVLWVVGMVFETVGDLQLTRFRGDPSTRGTVLDTGLWRYTRHPNYFGDFCVWWGVFALALGSPWVLLTVVGPVLMSRLLTRTTGKELMERHLSGRKGYAEYVARTSGFLPLPPGSRPARQS